MSINPKISIIIPYHRKKNFFFKTVNSILKQTYQNFEIILVYDDQNLKELLYLKKSFKKIKNFKIIVNKKILGPGLSRNKGIKFSSGKYIAFCDADDIWNRNKLKTQIQFMIKNKLNFSHSSYYIINRRDEKIGKFKIKRKLIFEDLIKSCDIGLSTVMLKKNLINNKIKFCNLKTKEDYYLWLKIIKKNRSIYGLKKYLVSWRFLEGSLSNSLKQKIMDAFKLYYYYEKYNVFISIFYVLRLSLYALKKKIKIYN